MATNGNTSDEVFGTMRINFRENNGRPYSSGKNALFSDRKLFAREIAK